MSTYAEQIPVAYRSLRLALDRAPTSKEIATRLGCTPARVGQVCKARGIPLTRRTQIVRERKARIARDRHNRRAATLAVHLQIAETCANRPDMTRAKIARAFGVSAATVTGVACACGLHRRVLFSDGEDRAVHATTARKAAVAQGRTTEVVLNRRCNLKIHRPRRRPITPDQWDALDRADLAGIRGQAAADATGLTYNQVSSVAQYLPVRRAWRAKHPTGRGA